MKYNHTFVVLAYKESQYLEECIKSVLNQTVKTNVVIATSTPNDFISKTAKKYKLDVIVNDSKEKGIGNDFNFAAHCVDSELVTIAHQDDIYDSNYAEEIIKNYKKYNDAIIIFPHYYEIKNGKKVLTNTNLKIKKVLLTLIKCKPLANTRFIKRSCIAFGNAIGCPSVTFITNKMPKEIFKNNFKCNIDWEAWENLSKLKGKFIYVNKQLMGHRVHEESTTTEIIKENIRTKEDLEMFKKFWPGFIAKILNNFYKNSEKGNNVKTHN